MGQVAGRAENAYSTRCIFHYGRKTTSTVARDQQQLTAKGVEK